MVDQRRFDNQPWVDAAAASTLLGVQRRTLYAYVSRGLVRSIPGQEAHARRYARDDLERLRARSQARAGHEAVAQGALRWGEPVLDTRVSTIDARGPVYRGQAAVDLVDAGFEAVFDLLTGASGPWQRPGAARLAGAPATRDDLPTSLLALTVAQAAAQDPDRDLAGLARMRELVARLAASCARPCTRERVQAALGAPTIAGVLARALGARGRAAVSAIDHALVLMADHELNASTFAARIVASTGADLYACLSGALAALSGPAHGAHSLRVEALVDECDDQPGRAAAVLRARRARGDDLAGFGHQLYPSGDPRVPPLLALVRRVRPAGARCRTVLALCDAARQQRLPGPNVDLGLVALTSALGLPRGSAMAIFAIGRTAGWLAHALEQRATGVMLRPRARYVG
jgi:citrate synthase